MLAIRSGRVPRRRARYAWQQGADIRESVQDQGDDLAYHVAALGHPVRLAVLREVLEGRHSSLEGRHSSAEMGAIDGLGTTGELYHHLRPLLAAG